MQPVPSWADPDVEYLEYWVDRRVSWREGRGPGVPKGVMTYDQATRAQVSGPWSGGRDNTYYKHFLKGWKGMLPHFLVHLFREYNDFALELFMKSTHMEHLDDQPDWSNLTVPDRYLYEHFNNWVREASNLAHPEHVCNYSYKHWLF